MTYNSPYSAPTVGQPIKSSPFAIMPNTWHQGVFQQDSGTKIQDLERRIQDLENRYMYQDQEFIRKINALYELLVNED